MEVQAIESTDVANENLSKPRSPETLETLDH